MLFVALTQQWVSVFKPVYSVSCRVSQSKECFVSPVYPAGVSEGSSNFFFCHEGDNWNKAKALSDIFTAEKDCGLTHLSSRREFLLEKLRICDLSVGLMFYFNGSISLYQRKGFEDENSLWTPWINRETFPTEQVWNCVVCSKSLFPETGVGKDRVVSYLNQCSTYKREPVTSKCLIF